MTTFATGQVRCAVCGAESEQAILTSTSRFGHSDLDMRPAEPQRSALWLEVQQCPSCGYCAAAIDEAPDRATAVVESEEYRRLLDSPGLPGLANAFLCSALVHEAAGKHAEGGWAAVSAAWACDDADADHAGRICRARAVTLFRAAREKGEPFADDAGSEAAVVVDLLRRSGQFDEAEAECAEGLRAVTDEVVRAVLLYERKLIGAGDDGRHSVDEAG